LATTPRSRNVEQDRVVCEHLDLREEGHAQRSWAALTAGTPFASFRSPSTESKRNDVDLGCWGKKHDASTRLRSRQGWERVVGEHQRLGGDASADQ